MERERGRSQLEPDPEESSSPSALPRLVGAARAAQGLDRLAIAARINSLLIAMRAPGNEAAEAKAILAELDVSALNGLVDGHGRDCRKEAVETLLACGFPHALEVSPEDLIHARKTASRERSQHELESEPDVPEVKPAVKWASWLTWAGAAVQLAACLHGLDSTHVLGLVGAGGAVLAGAAAWGLPQLRDWDGLGMIGVLLAGGALGGGIAAIGEQSPLMAATLVTGAAAYVLLNTQHEKR